MMATRSRGQSVVEFALVAPLFFALLFGIIAAGWLFFQSSAVNDAAQGGARDAIVINFNGSGLILDGSSCASGLPVAVQVAAQRAANILPVNPGNLCQVSAGGSFCPNTGGNTLLSQTAVTGDANIRMCVVGGVGSASSYSVEVTYIAHPLEPLLGASVDLKSISTLAAQQLPT